MALPYVGEEATCYTTSAVMEEVRGTPREDAVEMRLASGTIEVMDPDREHLREAEELAEVSGDLPVLSDADLTLLALALQLGSQGDVRVFTDDFALQNLLKQRGVDVSPVSRGEIGEVIRWRVRCTVCGRNYGSGYRGEECEECGGPLGRVAVFKRQEE